jgi:ATP-binding cassette subfamily B protein
MSGGTRAAPTWRIVLALIRRDARLYALSALLQSARLGFAMLPGFAVRALFDALAHSAAPGWNLWTLCALLVGAAVARGAALLSAVFVEATGVGRSSNHLRTRLFAHLQERPNQAVVALPPGDLINRLGADTRAVADELRALMLLFGIGVSALVAFGIMLSIEPYLALAASAPLVVAAVLFQAARARVEQLRAESRAADAAVSAFLGDVLAGVQSIQVAGAQAWVAGRLERLSAVRRRAALAERLFGDVVVIACTRTIAQIGSGLVLLLAGARLRSGSLSVGDFALFVTLLDSIADFAFYLGMHMAVYRQASVSLSRLRAVEPACASPQVVERPVAAKPVAVPALPPLETLDVRGLSVCYPGGRGIEQLDLSLRRGTLTIVTGRIGAGKTTLLRALLGLIERDAGVIEWNGIALPHPAQLFVPPQSAYTPQVVHLFSASIRDNIALGWPVTPQALGQALEIVDFGADLASLPDGLETQVGSGGLRLSGGQAQRVAGARMLVRDVSLLVLDDVSSALDAATERHLWQALDRLRQARPALAILAVSHRPEALRHADQVIVLDEGRRLPTPVVE